MRTMSSRNLPKRVSIEGGEASGGQERSEKGEKGTTKGFSPALRCFVAESMPDVALFFIFWNYHSSL